MTTFFVRLKSWQLELLMVAIFTIPLVILFTWFFFFVPKQPAPGPDVLILLFKTTGLIVALTAIFTFTWQWTTSRYLFGLLRSKENPDYEHYSAFNVVMLILALLWALLFWTGYIGVIPFLLIHHTWVLIPVFMVIIAAIYFLRHALAFRYKACEALLKEVPYHSVKAKFFSHILNQHWSVPQIAIREVYLKYGEKSGS